MYISFECLHFVNIIAQFGKNIYLFHCKYFNLNMYNLYILLLLFPKVRLELDGIISDTSGFPTLSSNCLTPLTNIYCQPWKV